jgi:PhzF family phenazine biosynthesis protein
MNGTLKDKETWLKYYRVNAFTTQPFSGNPAGVILDNIDLQDDEMQKIAKEIACSETAFIKILEETNFAVRFFSPTTEVDLCGHATIATFFALADRNYIKNKADKVIVKQKTKSGILPVEIYYKNGKVDKVMMKQKKPTFKKVDIDLDDLSKALQVEKEEINTDFPMESVSTGLFSLPVNIRRLRSLRNMEPNFRAIKELCKSIGVGSIHVFSFETIEKNNSLHARNFAPLYGVNEDPVTGTANGALCAYLVKNKLVEEYSFICEQGDIIGRPGRVFVKVSCNNNSVEDVYVGGKAIIVQEGVVRVR